MGAQGEPARPKRTIAASERTNLWTVCLTSAGVLGYLNRRISPLGACARTTRSRPSAGWLPGVPPWAHQPAAVRVHARLLKQCLCSP